MHEQKVDHQKHHQEKDLWYTKKEEKNSKDVEAEIVDQRRMKTLRDNEKSVLGNFVTDKQAKRNQRRAKQMRNVEQNTFYRNGSDNPVADLMRGDAKGFMTKF